MSAIIECVPNFSEGRRPEVINAIAAAAAEVAGAALLSSQSDYDHNRMVVTIAGSPGAVSDSVFAAARRATELIDMANHHGVHPRIGAIDVVPFVPIQDSTMQDCIELARTCGERLGRELHVPVFLYGAAASISEHSDLAAIRKGQYERMIELLGTERKWTPDFGPRQMNIKTGAAAVGARGPLIAFNAFLKTDDLRIARAIADSVRGRSGGLPHVKALGLRIESRGCVQVSMNLTDYRQTSLRTVFNQVTELARELGSPVSSSELIGLIPREAVWETAEQELKLEGSLQDAIMEDQIQSALGVAVESISW